MCPYPLLPGWERKRKINNPLLGVAFRRKSLTIFKRWQKTTGALKKNRILEDVHDRSDIRALKISPLLLPPHFPPLPLGLRTMQARPDKTGRLFPPPGSFVIALADGQSFFLLLWGVKNLFLSLRKKQEVKLHSSRPNWDFEWEVPGGDTTTILC